MASSGNDKATAQVIEFPDLPAGRGKGAAKRSLMGPEVGTQFDIGTRLFAYYLRWRRHF